MKRPVRSLHPVAKHIEPDALIRDVQTAQSEFIKKVREIRDDSAMRFRLRVQNGRFAGPLTSAQTLLRASARFSPAIRSLRESQIVLRSSEMTCFAIGRLFDDFSHEAESWCERVCNAITDHVEVLFRLSPENVEQGAATTRTLLADEYRAWFPDAQNWADLRRLDRWPIDLNLIAGAMAVLKGSFGTETAARLDELVKKLRDHLSEAMTQAVAGARLHARTDDLQPRNEDQVSPLKQVLTRLMRKSPEKSYREICGLADDDFANRETPTPIPELWQRHYHSTLVGSYDCSRCGKNVEVYLSRVRKPLNLFKPPKSSRARKARS